MSVCLSLGMAYGMKVFSFSADRVRLEDFENIPDEITVSYSQNPFSFMAPDAEADVIVPEFRGSVMGYRWSYVTTIATKAERIRIDEFYEFEMEGLRWKCTNQWHRNYTNIDFASWYHCKDGVLEPGLSYSRTPPSRQDGSDWVSEGEQTSRPHMWLFIGTNESGKSVKGQARVRKRMSENEYTFFQQRRVKALRSFFVDGV